MAAGATYYPLKTTTLSVAAASVTLSSIPSTYTDLRLIVTGTDSAYGALAVQVNGDTGSHYDYLIGYGNGSVTGAVQSLATTQMNIGLSDTTQFVSIFEFMNYSNTTTYKGVIGRGNTAANQTRYGTGLWKGSTGSSTEAINSITLLGTSFQVGTTFTLYGIAAA